jgi:hypothetical protein
MKISVSLMCTMHTIQGYEVEVRPAIQCAALLPAQGYDLYIYCWGHNAPTAPTQHDSVESALSSGSHGLMHMVALQDIMRA